jgi:hypothetical protein
MHIVLRSPQCYRAREAPFSNRNPRKARCEQDFSHLRLSTAKSRCLATSISVKRVAQMRSLHSALLAL